MRFVNTNPTTTRQEDFWVTSATITNTEEPDCNTNIAITDLTGFVLVSRPSVSRSMYPSVAPSVSVAPSDSSVAPSVAPSVSKVPSVYPSVAPSDNLFDIDFGLRV